jgi:hypothetical protein
MPPTTADRSEETAISLLTHLLRDTCLFQKSADYKALLDFTVFTEIDLKDQRHRHLERLSWLQAHVK